MRRSHASICTPHSHTGAWSRAWLSFPYLYSSSPDIWLWLGILVWCIGRHTARTTFQFHRSSSSESARPHHTWSRISGTPIRSTCPRGETCRWPSIVGTAFWSGTSSCQWDNYSTLWSRNSNHPWCENNRSRPRRRLCSCGSRAGVFCGEGLGPAHLWSNIAAALGYVLIFAAAVQCHQGWYGKRELL